MEWIFRRYFDKAPVLSPLFFYAEELLAAGDFPQDDGSDGVTGSSVATSKGCCEDSLYPDAGQKIQKPTPEMLANAWQYALGAYHGVSDSETAATILCDPVPWPIEVGFQVYESFEADWAIPGVMPMPTPGESVLGGHEIVNCCGYDFGASPTLRPAGCPPAFSFQNSWGADWGLNGRFWMPKDFVDQQLASGEMDIKIVHSGKPWA
jgi:hypothetical protein